MDFKKAQKAAKTLCILAMILALGSLITLADYPQIELFVYFIAILFLIISFWLIKTYCKCPHCGYDSIKKAFNRTVCPNCGRNIETGKKEKKVKKKK